MKKLSWVSILFIILTIGWMCFIFMMSSRDADTSTEDSYKVGMLVGRIFVPGFSEKGEAEQLEFAALVDHPIRKIAHGTEYAMLAILTFAAIGDFIKSKIRVGIAWGWATLYAVTDEIHQLFVPGRSGQFTDVCIDSAGAWVGVLFCVLVMFIHARRKATLLKKGRRLYG